MTYHRYDEESIYQASMHGTSSGSVYAGSGRGQGSVPHGLNTSKSDYSNEANPQAYSENDHESSEMPKLYVPHGLGRDTITEEDLDQLISHTRRKLESHNDRLPATGHVGYLPKSTTVGSIVKKYENGHDNKLGFDNERLKSNNERAVEARPNHGKGAKSTFRSKQPDLSQFEHDFGHNRKGLSSESTETLTVKPLNLSKKKVLHASAGQPPQDPLPSLPSSQSPRPAFEADRDQSFATENSSVASTYGMTRNLLNLSLQQLPTNIDLGTSRGTLAIDSEEAESGAVAKIDNEQSKGQSSSELLTAPVQVHYRRVSDRDASDRSHGRISMISLDGSVHSRPLSHHEAEILERQISAELRRVSYMSGRSDHAKALALHQKALSNGGYEVQFSDGSGEVVLDLGPGGSQSLSSGGPLSQPGSYRSNQDDFEDSSNRGLSRNAMDSTVWYGGSKGKGSFASSLLGTNSAGSPSEGRITGEIVRDASDADWETVGESHQFSRQNTRDTLAQGQTGSSLADYSSFESLRTEVHKWTPSAAGQQVLQHPADRRYHHSSFLHKDAQSGDVVLLPEYTFTGGAGFPNRNALTPPVMANSFVNNPYQHPTPLSKDHVHPFNSSPPPISSVSAPNPTYTCLHPSVHTLGLSDGEYELLKPDTYCGERRGVYDLDVHENLPSGSAAGNDLIKHSQRDVSFVTSQGAGDVDGSYPSSNWLSTLGEASGEVRGSEELPDHNGSFSKVTALGPKVNITGTPKGTGMREVGSSLADGSSPGVKFSSSPDYPTNSPYAQHQNLDQQASRVLKSEHGSHRRVKSGSDQFKGKPGRLYEAVREQGLRQDSNRPLGFMHDTIRAHRRQLAAANLLPCAFTPPEPKRYSTPLSLVSLIFPSVKSRESSPVRSATAVCQPETPTHSTYPTTSLAPLSPERAQTSTARIRMERPTTRHFHQTPRLVPRPRNPTAAVLQRQKELGIMFIALLTICPPLWLIIGFGGMDDTMTSILRGEVVGFRAVDKKVAMILGCGVSVASSIALVAIIIWLVLR
ncbi:MAG: hypothetical protein M1830_003294 [Pleopsidium flavum]|nr:MAG: hypothetical protein M1830_003294 [Pleopsidium flavum]